MKGRKRVIGHSGDHKIQKDKSGEDAEEELFMMCSVIFVVSVGDVVVVALVELVGFVTVTFDSF